MISAKKLDDNIPMLTANDQYVQGTVIQMGIDTEMLFKVGKKTLWPHREGLGQERLADTTAAYDWHGDGYAFELCTHPSTCLEWLCGFIGEALKDLSTKYKDKLTLVSPTVYKVPYQVRNSAPEVVKKLGCTPSINVYADRGTPEKLGEFTRTTGCHLHLSSLHLRNEKVALALVKWADVIVGNVWNYVSPEDPKQEILRRQAYGRAGEYRTRVYPPIAGMFKSSGVEYRVLPGTVIRNPVYLTLCFNLYRTALRFALDKGEPPEELTDISRTAINTANKDLSEDVIKWLPFDDNCKKVLKIIKDDPLPALTPMQWYEASKNHNLQGHTTFACNKGVW
jgi:hypothetical protein